MTRKPKDRLEDRPAFVQDVLGADKIPHTHEYGPWGEGPCGVAGCEWEKGGWKPPAQPEPESDYPRSELVFLDVETVGIDPVPGGILEVGIIVTSGNLEPVAQCHCYVGGGPDCEPTMNPWAVEQHTKSGLLAGRTDAIHMGKAVPPHGLDRYLSQWFERFGFTKGSIVLCGYSVHYDRRWIQSMLPEVSELLHRRQVDVSTFRECIRRWADPMWMRDETKQSGHRALLDCEAAIAEMITYRDMVQVQVQVALRPRASYEGGRVEVSQRPAAEAYYVDTESVYRLSSPSMHLPDCPSRSGAVGTCNCFRRGQ